MKRLTIIALLLCATSLSAQTPTLVQHKSQSTTLAPPPSLTNPSVSTGGSYKVTLPNTTLANNTILACFTYASTNTTVTVTDDNSDSFTTEKLETDSANGQSLILALAKTTGGAHVVSFNNSTGAGVSFVQGHVSEFMNVATTSPVDGTVVGATPTSASVAAGSITTTVSGDLIYQCAFNSANAAYSSATVGSGFGWLGLDISTGFATQWEVKAASGAINPTFTQGTSSKVVTIGIALKAASAGTAPAAGIHILKEQGYNTQNESSTSVTWTMPGSTGNLLVATESAGCSASNACDNVTAVADSNSNSWTEACGILGGSSDGSAASVWYTTSPPTLGNTMTMTFTKAGNDATGHGDTYKIFEITGAATSSQLDLCSTASGTQPTGTAGNIATVTMTPGNQNEIGILAGGEAFNSATGWTSPSGMVFTGCTFTGITNPTNCDENNPYGVYYNVASTSSITATYSHDASNSAGSGEWEVAMGFFKPPGVVTSTPSMNKRRKLETLDSAR